MGTPIVILDDDTPGPLSNSVKQQQQQHLPGPQGHSNRRAITPRRLNLVSSPPMRPSSISANPSIASVGGLAQGAPHAAARRRAVHRGGAAAEPRPPQAAGQRRNSNSSSSSSVEQVDVDADALLAQKLAQEEEDRVLAQRLMQEEEQQAQVWNNQQFCSLHM
jgi:hypothetical protein